MGHTPSLMDYARLNYVAQPEDRIDPADLVPRVGPYDVFATMWGYKPIPGARTPDAERPTLNAWAEMQDSIPWYRHSTSGDANADPGNASEAVGDADAVKSTGYGLRNIRRVVPLLMTATLRPGEDNAELIEIYQRLIDQWTQELEHVVNHPQELEWELEAWIRARVEEAFGPGQAHVTPPPWLVDHE